MVSVHYELHGVERIAYIVVSNYCITGEAVKARTALTSGNGIEHCILHTVTS